MFHKFLKPGPWFRVKKYGYGAGLPIVWQGWAFLAALIGVLGGIGLLADNKSGWAQAISTAAFILTIVYAITIAAQRTDGEWRWRWGEKDVVPSKRRTDKHRADKRPPRR